MENRSVQQWNPEFYVTPQQSLLNHKIAVIVLNRPILVQRELFVYLWNSGTYILLYLGEHI